MEYKIHPIKKYNYAFDARLGRAGKMQLWGEKGEIAQVIFMEDTAPVPAPVPSSDLNSVKIFFHARELTGLISKLRHESPLGLTITGNGDVAISKIYGLADSVVVCSACDPNLLAAKTRGIQEALRRLIEFCGADALPKHCPVTFHLDDDGYCGPYQQGKTTGYASLHPDPPGFGHVCLYYFEHNAGKPLPSLIQQAEKINDQLLAVHEAMHIWFFGRIRNYNITEPFCKLVSFIISEMSGGPEYCQWFNSTPSDHPDVLMKYLCEIGITTQRAAQILKQLAESVSEQGRALTDIEFANLVSEVLGRDAIPAFRSAGILS